MHFRRHIQLELGLKPIDIAPLIGMVFILLIFLIATPVFVAHPGRKVDLGRAITGEAVKYENLEVAISSENTIYINDKVINTQELKVLLKQAAGAKQFVLIKADRHASLDRIVEIWDMCRVLGITQVNIATN